MRPGRLVSLGVATALIAGCGEEEIAPPAQACTDAPAAIVRALAAAPGAVRLADGTALSACVGHARTASALQDVGVALTSAAEELEQAALAGDERAALQLGYLIGATRRGAEETSGLGAELVRRVERSGAAADAVGPRHGAAVRRGMAAGAGRG
jgi:hypothetical protein